MTDSMVWNAMTTSMQLAQECLKEDPSTGEEQAEASAPFEGLESFAQTIESGMYWVENFIFTALVIWVSDFQNCAKKCTKFLYLLKKNF